VNPLTSPGKKWLVRIAKIAVFAVVIWAVRQTLADAWKQLGAYPWQFRPGWLVVSGGLYLVGLLPAGLFWHRVLRVLGQQARLGETLRAYYVGHLGKYVPGKAMVVILRAGMIRGRRVDTGVAAVSVFFETLTMMAVGAFLAAAVLALGFRDRSFVFYGAVGLMLASALPTLPPIFQRLVRLARVGKSDPAIAEKIGKLGYGSLAAGWLTMTLVWSLLGLSYWASLRAMGIPDLNPLADLPRYTAGVSLAMVAGFLLLVLPGGLGVREAALVKIMIPYLTPRVPDAAELAAWASAAVLRLVWVLSEVLIAALMGIAMRRRRPADTGPENPLI
jgi:hypothetical protein